MSHECEAIVVACIDFRFQRFLDNWLANRLGHGNYDRVGIAGGVKNLDVGMSQIELAIDLHHIRRVVLINHEDCGAYGDEGTRERHEADLKAARQHILRKYPHVEVETYFAKLDGAFEWIK